jgi:hypothetical protein
MTGEDWLVGAGLMPGWFPSMGAGSLRIWYAGRLERNARTHATMTGGVSHSTVATTFPLA